MKKTISLKKNYEFKYILNKGKYFRGQILEGFYIKNNKNINYLGIAISSKLCNAVKRNKIKRIIRETYKNLENKINQGYTFVFLWKKNVDINKCVYNEILKDMMYIFKTMDIYND